jgi:hypothetical protein
MSSLRQIDANRQNAAKSTGPKTNEGKRRSRRNAVRHGLTAETVIDALEDPADYKAFEASVAAGYDPQTAVERELVLRLASLLWRLRRATAIETGLFQIRIRGELGERKNSGPHPLEHGLNTMVQTGELESAIRPDGKWNGNNGENYRFVYGNATCDSAEGVVIEPDDISRRFLQLAKLDDGGFERLNRYETSLWRQVCQVIFTLDALRRQNLDIKWLPRPTPAGARFRFFSRSAVSKP